MTSSVVDPFDVANETAERLPRYFGKIDCTADFVATIKGQGKMAWHEGLGIEQRRVEISISLNPIDAMNLTRTVDRQVLADTKEWKQIVWPSLKALGIENAREIHGKWAKVELVKSGRSWTNKTTGEIVEGTTFKFLALYDTKAMCEAAWDAEYNQLKAHSPAADDPAMAIDMSPRAGSPKSDDAERETARLFLKAMVKGSKGDMAQLARNIGNMPQVAKYFSIDSPEVLSMMGE